MPETTSFTVLIVEPDRGAVRQIQSCLTIAGLQVLRPAHTLPEALVALEMTPPDVAVVDLGLVADQTMRRALADAASSRSIPLVYLSSATDRSTLARVLDGQGTACVIKPLVERQLISTVTLAAMAARAGAALAAPRRTELEQKLRDIAAIVSDIEHENSTAPSARKATSSENDEIASVLSAREKQIVDLLANGARVVTIARQLQLSPHTVRNHLKSVFRKLNLHGQHELYEYWHRQAG